MTAYQLRQVRDDAPPTAAAFSQVVESTDGRGPVPTEEERGRMFAEQIRMITAPVLPPGPSMSLDDARAQLRDAIAEREQAEAPLRAARDAVLRAEGELAKCHAEIAHFSQIDRETAERQLLAMREWAAEGGDAPPPDFAPPPDPAQRAQAFSALEKKRDVIAKAIAALRLDVAAAEKQSEPARQAVCRAAAMVLVIDTEAKAVRLAAVEAEARALRFQLQPRAAFSCGPAAEALPLSIGARRLLESKPVNVWTNDGRDPADQRALQARFDALLHDPDAVLE